MPTRPPPARRDKMVYTLRHSGHTAFAMSHTFLSRTQIYARFMPGRTFGGPIAIGGAMREATGLPVA